MAEVVKNDETAKVGDGLMTINPLETPTEKIKQGTSKNPKANNITEIGNFILG